MFNKQRVHFLGLYGYGSQLGTPARICGLALLLGCLNSWERQRSPQAMALYLGRFVGDLRIWH